MNRQALHELIDAIPPLDTREARDIEETLEWIESGRPLYRVQKPDIPPKHLVSYFAVIDPEAGTMLLQDHLLAKLWLPPGGHVEPDEDPAQAAIRECEEELGFAAGFLGAPKPQFITATTTNGQGKHTDVSLWYTLKASQDTPLIIEDGKFKEVRWWNIQDIKNSPLHLFDPEMHRFIAKIEDVIRL